MKNKLLVMILILLILVGCATKNDDTNTPPEPQETKFTYQINEPIEFVEGDTVDFSGKIIGNFDTIEFGEIKHEVGEHVLAVTLIKNDEKKVIAVPYRIKEKVLSSNYLLEKLSFDNYELEPSFSPEIDVYTLRIPSDIVSVNVSAKTQDAGANITSGVGVMENLGYDFEHHVDVVAEDGTQFYYLIYVVLSDVVSNEPIDGPVAGDIEIWNGYELNYPNSQLATHRSDLLTLVNKQYQLEESYVPSNLVLVDQEYQVYGGAHLVSEAYDAYIRMRQAASEAGLNLNVSTCYRDYDFQRTLYTMYLEQDPQSVVDTYSARPGHSEHQLGYSCDFAAGVLNVEDFTGTDEEIWMRDNAVDYGFILRFPQNKSDITGYMYESWHYRYVGVQDSKEIKRLGLTLEEYLNQ